MLVYVAYKARKVFIYNFVAIDSIYSILKILSFLIKQQSHGILNAGLNFNNKSGYISGSMGSGIGLLKWG